RADGSHCHHERGGLATARPPRTRTGGARGGRRRRWIGTAGTRSPTAQSETDPAHGERGGIGRWSAGGTPQPPSGWNAWVASLMARHAHITNLSRRSAPRSETTTIWVMTSRSGGGVCAWETRRRRGNSRNEGRREEKTSRAATD